MTFLIRSFPTKGMFCLIIKRIIKIILISRILKQNNLSDCKLNKCGHHVKLNYLDVPFIRFSSILTLKQYF
jgi:hypothetical protein